MKSFVSRAAVKTIAAALLLLFTAVSAFSQSADLSYSPTTYSAVGDTINYTVTVNPGAFDVLSVTSVTSQLQGGITFTCQSPNGNNPFTCSGSRQANGFDVQAGSFGDFVRVTGTKIGGGGTFSADTPTRFATLQGGGPVSVTVDSSPRPSTPGQLVTVRAEVSSQGCEAGLAPTGSVTIGIGPQSSTIPLTFMRPDRIGGSYAEYQTSTLPTGTHAVTAQYLGNSFCSTGSAPSFNHLVDTQPTVTINQAGGQSDPTGTSPINFSVVFSKNVTGFGNADVQLSGTAGATTATVSGSGSTYNVAVSGMAQGGTVIATVPANVASASGLQNLASTSTDNSVSFVVITVNPASVPSPMVGTAYNQTFTSTGGAGASTFAISAGALPPGLTLSAGGGLTGTPTAAGAFNFTVRATDTNNISGTRAYSFVVDVPFTSISPSMVPNAAVATAYSETLFAHGGIAPYTYAVTAGSLPAGLSLHPNTGALTGTPTAGGTFNFTVTATGSSTGAGAPHTGSRAYTLVVNPPTVTLPATSLTDGAAGASYSATLNPATGGTAPYTYAVTAGALPTGITLNPGTGGLSGTPAAYGNFNFAITATDSSTGSGPYASAPRGYSIYIAGVPGAPTIGTATAGNQEATVTFSPPASAGGAPIDSYTVTSDPGNVMASGTASPITVTGLTNGTAYTFTVTATNSIGEGSPSAASNSVTPTGPQTITFDNPGAQDFGTAPTLAATASSNLAVTFTSQTMGVCTITPTGALTFSTAGNCTIDADQGGNAAFDPAPTVSQTFAVNAVAPDAPGIGMATAGDQQATVNFTAPMSNGGALITSYTVTSSPGSFTAVVGAAGAATVTGLTNGQSYTFTVTATNAANLTSQASTPSNSVTPQGPQTITFGNPGTQDFGTTPTLSATATSLLPVTFTSSTMGVCTITPQGELTFVAAGSCTINADQAGDAAFLPAPQVSQTFAVDAVAPGAPTINSVTAGDTDATVNFSAPASSGGVAITSYTVTSSPGSFTAVVGAAGSATVGGLTNGESYTFTVTATNAANLTGPPATSGAAVPKGNQTIIFANPGTQNFNATLSLAQASSTSGLPLTFTSQTPAVCSVTPPATVTFSSGGTCTIDADQPGDAAYLPAPTVSQSFTVLDELTIDPPNLPNATAAQPYSATLPAVGGLPPYTITVDEEVLPSGLTYANGTISGTPTGGSGNFSFMASITDSNGGTGQQTVTLTVLPPVIAIEPSSLPNPVYNQAYSQTLTATGSIQPYTFSVTAGALPAGLTLDRNGVLSGTPTASGNFGFTVTATDANGESGTKSYNLTITAPFIAVSPETLGGATAGAPYSATITAMGGVAPHDFTVTSGALPAGLTLSSTGALSGTPTESGNFNITITASDVNDQTGSKNYVLAVAVPNLALTPSGLPGGTAGAAYSQTISASGGVAPYSYAVTAGALPAGLTLSGAGVLSGTPTANGTFVITITATDSTGGTAATVAATYSLVIGTPTLTLAPSSLPAGIAGTAYSQTIAASGGVAPYTYAVTAGTLPAGLTLSSAGALSGTPTQAGTFNITIAATDSTSGTAATISATYALVIASPTLTMTPSSLPAGTAGTVYSQTIAASGGVAPYTYAVTAGSLPPGLTLSGAGLLSGTTTQSGTFNITITATDSTGGTAATVSVSYALVIATPTLTLTPSSLPAGAAGSAYSQTFVASGGIAPYSYALTAGTLPTGLTLAADGTLAGTPTTDGTFNVTITATDSTGGTPATLSVAYVLIIDPTLRPDPSLDPEVIGLVNAQVDSARRFASAQISNFRDRLETLHSETDRRENSFGMSITSEDNDERPGLAFAQEDKAKTGPDDSRFGYPAGSLDKKGILKEEAEESRPMVAPSSSSKVAFWTGGFVNFGSREGTGIDLDQTLIGISGGVDYRFSPKFVAGIGFGYGREDVDIGTNGTESKGQAISAAIYGSYKPAPNLFLDGLLGYSRLSYDSKRFASLTNSFAMGQRSGDQVFGYVSFGYDYRRGGLLLSPYSSLEMSWTRLDGFTETGAGIGNLIYGEHDFTSVSGVLGIRAEVAVEMDWGLLKPHGRIEYRHDFEGTSRATVGYADLGTLPFGFDVKPFSRDNIAVNLGFDAELDSGWAFGFDYRTAFGFDGDSQDHSVAAKIRKRF